MITERKFEMKEIKLWENNTPYYNAEYGQPEPSMIPFIVEGSKYCMIVLPGGGYSMRAMEHEGYDIANLLNQNGISAFVVNYRVAPYDHRAFMADGKRAVRLVRYLAREYGYDERCIGIMGFSAGGHLCMVTSYHSDEGDPNAADPVERMSSRPNATALCYGVISLDFETHSGTRRNFIGKEITDEAEIDTFCKKYSGENSITENTPPTFLWHTEADGGVPVSNSLNMAAALCKNKIPCELHIYPYGGHGKGLCVGKHEIPLAHTWFDQMVSFMKYHFDKTLAQEN